MDQKVFLQRYADDTLLSLIKTNEEELKELTPPTLFRPGGDKLRPLGLLAARLA